MESPLAVSTAAPYCDFPNLKPGDRIAVEIDGYLEAHVITETTRKSGMLVFDPKLSRWGQVKRFLTPTRWRGPLPGYHRTSDTVEITSVPVAHYRLHRIYDELVSDCGLLAAPPNGSPSPGPLAGDGEPHQP